MARDVLVDDIDALADAGELDGDAALAVVHGLGGATSLGATALPLATRSLFSSESLQ